MKCLKSEIVEQIKLIDRPQSHFAGTPKLHLALPENIICAGISEGRTSTRQIASIHHRYLLLIALEGSGDAIINSERYSLHENECILVFPHQAHFFHHIEKQISWLFFSFEIEDALHLQALDSKILPFNEICLKFLSHFIGDYSVETLNDIFLSPKRSFLLSLILDEVIREEKKQGKIKKRKRSHEAKFIDQVNRYIVNNLQKPLSVHIIADNFHYSSSHLRAIYKKSMGVSLGEYIKEMRFHKACNLLVNSAMNITEVAKACGYESLFSFSHAFKNKEKLSPQKYRIEYGKN